MSVQSQINGFLNNLKAPASIAEVINKTKGDYDEVSLALRNSPTKIKLAGRTFKTPYDVKQFVNGVGYNTKVTPRIQKALGQNPADTNVDDFDDVLKVVNASNIKVIPKDYVKKTKKSVKDPVNNAMDKSKIVNKKTLAVAGIAAAGLAAWRLL